MKPETVLVTGGAGYKGVVLVTRLLQEGYRVTVFDNFMYGYESIVHLVSEPNLTVVQGDVRDISSEALSKHDAIFHLAGLSGMPACAANSHSAVTINVQGTARLVSLLRPDQLLVYASTTSLYGVGPNVCDETFPVRPSSLYSKTKYEGENICQQRPNSISLRFATVFGTSPRMRNDLLVNDFTYRAINERALVLFGSHSRRTFVHIKDAAEAYLFAIEHADEMRGQVFNIGSKRLNLSKRDIANAIQQRVECEIFDSTIPDRDSRDFQISFERIGRLGFETHFTLDDGIDELLRLYAFYKVHSHYRVI